MNEPLGRGERLQRQDLDLVHRFTPKLPDDRKDVAPLDTPHGLSSIRELPACGTRLLA
jgi:hypothetical protein